MIGTGARRSPAARFKAAVNAVFKAFRKPAAIPQKQITIVIYQANVRNPIPGVRLPFPIEAIDFNRN